MATSGSTTEKGQALEHEVASIYRQLDGVRTVTPNKSMKGTQVDVYVEIETADGTLIRYAVDAKNFAGRVPIDEVRKTKDALQSLRNDREIDRGIIVSSNGFTKDAHALVAGTEITLLDLSELRLKVADFRPYLHQWIEEFEHSTFYESGYYIPLSARTDFGDQPISTIDKWLLDWINEPGALVALLGNYGTGKSTSLRQVMWLQAKRYLANPSEERIPIFVELKEYRQAPKVSMLLTDVLVNEYGLRITYRRFREMNEAGRFLILLDGFDEMADKVLEGMPEEHFDALSALASDAGKVVLSCRTHYFRDYDQVIDVFSGETELYRRARSAGCQILYLNPFSEKDIDEYLKRVFKDGWKRYRRIIDRTYNLKELAQTPILLWMLVETLPTLVDQGREISRPLVYESFTNKWLERDRRRGALHTTERRYFCDQLAWYLYHNQQASLHWTDLPKFVKEHFAERVESQTDLDVFSHDVRTCTFLVREEKSGRYSFAHRSFMEYFVAVQYLDRVRSGVENGLDGLRGKDTRNRVVMDFLSEMLAPQDLEVLLSRAKIPDCNDDITVRDNHVKERSTTYSSPDSLGACAHLLLAHGYSLTRTDLSAANLAGIALKGFDLSESRMRGADLDGCILVNTNLAGTDLSFAKFGRATLRNVCFAGANLDGADLNLATIDAVTIRSIATAAYWAGIRIQAADRHRIEVAYQRPSEVQTYLEEPKRGK